MMSVLWVEIIVANTKRVIFCFCINDKFHPKKLGVKSSFSKEGGKGYYGY